MEIDNGTIAAMGEGHRSGGLDLRGAIVAPGFVDMHVHGGGGASFACESTAEVRRAIAFHHRHGTTTMMASLATQAFESLVSVTRLLSPMVNNGELAGIHYEGPYLSERYRGCHDAALLRQPDPTEMLSLARSFSGICMVTVAPELTGALPLVAACAEEGHVVAIGHTACSFEEARAAFDFGASVASHLFNGMPGIRAREPGPVVASLTDPRVFVELINDGAHVHDAVLAVAWLAARERVALVTDAIPAAGLGDGRFQFGELSLIIRGNRVQLADGSSLAGSTLTMDRAVRRAVRCLQIGLPQAVAAASTQPSKALGIHHKVGRLEPGLLADLVVLNRELAILGVMRGGSWILNPTTDQRTKTHTRGDSAPNHNC
jgi:N-acetylglucosamine-6-phosphate deacetylase